MDFLWNFFHRFVKTTFKVSRRNLWESNFSEKVFSQSQNVAVGFSELHLACPVFFLRKIVYWYGNPKLSKFLSPFEEKISAIFRKEVGKLRLNMRSFVQTKFLLKICSKHFCEKCPKIEGKNVKIEIYVTGRFSWGNFCSRKNYTFVVIPGRRTKIFRTFNKRFSTIVKTAVYVSTDKFCGKKLISSVPDFEPKISGSFPKKFEKVFETASCVSKVRFWGKLIIVVENKNKNIFGFFCFLARKLFENLS